jgi:hypothetical protein
MWLTSSVLVGALALYRLDPVFIALQATSLSSAAVIVVLARRYRGMFCETHAQDERNRETLEKRRTGRFDPHLRGTEQQARAKRIR